MNELINGILAKGWDYKFLTNSGGCIVFYRGNESLMFDNDDDLSDWLEKELQ